MLSPLLWTTPNLVCTPLKGRNQYIREICLTIGSAYPFRPVRAMPRTKFF